MTAGARRALVAAGVALLLGIHFTLAVASKAHEGTTSDELVFVTGGLSYWRLDDYRLHPENGNLAQRWVSLPWELGHARFPGLDQPYWKVSDAWVMGHELFYETGEDHFPRLMESRAMTALLSVALGALIFLWSRSLFGAAGGLVSLGFYAFNPNFLAHGGLATSDVCISLFFLASLWAYWRHLERPGAARLAASAVLFGLSCVAKFSAPLLIPMFLACAAAHMAVRGTRASRVALSAAAHAAAAFCIIWASYGFRYSAFNPRLPEALQFIQSWPDMYRATGGVGRVIHAMANLRLLPEAFLYGAAYVDETSRTRAAFLNGACSVTGWRSFFVWTFFLKETIPFIIAAALGIWISVRARLRAPARAAALLPIVPLLVLLAGYWAVTLTSHLNIGIRHLLPMYPALFILAGSLASLLPWRAGAALVGALLVWNAAEAAFIYPHYIAYFNELGGGPSHGASHLVDSSLDWGQDLPGLKDWLVRNRRPGEDAYLAYFGTDEPRYYPLGVKRLAYMNLFQEDEPYIPLGPGLYCIGATMLEQPYNTVNGPWTDSLEKEYEFLRDFEPVFRRYAEDPAARRDYDAHLSPEKWRRSRDRFLHLRFARLCFCLRARRPDAEIGYSIYAYRLSEEDVRAATGGSLRDWAGLIERWAAGSGAR
ncbi:MAG TPA: glycosyltransferase family 39 protein [Opitutaceae bacterium]|jgi:hypothetical protein